MSHKAREIIEAVDDGRMTVDEGLREIQRWRQQRREERLRDEARRSGARPARWLRVRVFEPGRGRRFNIWLPLFLVFWVISLGLWVMTRFVKSGRKFAERWRSSGAAIPLGPSEYREALAGLRVALRACGKIVDVEDDDGTRVEVWLG